ncbi:MAG: hypothetical protein H7A46_17685 [Verrucomicrobiales bacterium]|nr:hypothetical protein [Verrucomicrobiales bacterium]
MNKLLHNKWVVSLLALAAVALLAMQFWPKSTPRRSSSGTTRNSKPSAGTPQDKDAGNATNAATMELAAAGPEREVERGYFSRRYEVWRMLDNDPFETPAPEAAVPVPPPEPTAPELLTVTGLWLQTGARLAVVNGAVLGEGDTILHYTVQSITFDGIWVIGRLGREQVLFDKLSVREAAAPASAKPPSNPKRAPASA